MIYYGVSPLHAVEVKGIKEVAADATHVLPRTWAPEQKGERMRGSAFHERTVRCIRADYVKRASESRLSVLRCTAG
jgi:hypothetical protein